MCVSVWVCDCVLQCVSTQIDIDLPYEQYCGCVCVWDDLTDVVGTHVSAGVTASQLSVKTSQLTRTWCNSHIVGVTYW